MKAQFDQKLLSSFFLWFDDRVTRYGEAVESNISQMFYYSENSVDLPDNKIAYYSPDRQFVSNGDAVPDGVYVKGGSVGSDYVFVRQEPNSTTGLMIDHDQGRVIFNSSVGTDLTVSGSFARKTLNTYITNESEEELLLNTDFLLADQDDQTFLEAIQGFSSLNYTLPAAFISYNSSNNKPFALGGLQDTRSNIRAVIIANDNYTLDSALSLFRDSAEVCLPIIDYAEFPYGEFFHVKEPPYLYETLYQQKMNSNSQYAFIEKITSSKLYDTSSSALNLPRNMRIGFLDFTISTPRLPKIELGEPSTLVIEPEILEEEQLSITNKSTESFFLPQQYWPENRGFANWRIKDNINLPSSKLSYFFVDEISTRPDDFTADSPTIRVSSFFKQDNNKIYVETEANYELFPLYNSVITFTIEYY